MRWALVFALAVLLLGAGCLDGNPSAKARKASGKSLENEAPQAPSGPIAHTFEYEGRSELSLCLASSGECTILSEGTNSPWTFDSEGSIVRIEGSVEEIRGPGPYHDIGAWLHVWLLDSSDILGSSRGNSFKFEPRGESDDIELALRVTFQGENGSGRGDAVDAGQQRDFRVKGTFYTK